MITSHGDWVITFGKTIQVISYTLPGRNSEYVAYQAYMSGLFTSITPSFHSRVIDLDKAIRLQAAKSTFTSVTLPTLTTLEPYISPHLVWVWVPERESKAPQSVMQDLPFLEAESPATTGIEAPVIVQHLNAHTRISVITVGVGELTDDQNIQSKSLNQELSRGQNFRRHFVWDPAAAVRSRTVHWTELAEPLPSPSASEFDNVEALHTIHSYPDLFAIVVNPFCMG